MMYVTRRESFSAAHRLFRPDWSEERNTQIYGKCSNPAFHGHNYAVEITVAGEVNPETGYLIDLKVLKAIIQERVIEPLDHKNLNTDVDFLSGVVPTAENIAIAVWNRLVGHIPAGRLYEVRIHETEHNVVWYRGEE